MRLGPRSLGMTGLFVVQSGGFLDASSMFVVSQVPSFNSFWMGTWGTLQTGADPRSRVKV